jgi:hypothetical protein
MGSVEREDRKRHNVSKTGSDSNVPSVYWLITWESRLPEASRAWKRIASMMIKEI